MSKNDEPLRPRYSPADVAALKSRDVLLAYCEKRLGKPKRTGSTWYFPCPYGNHTRPKLSVGEKNGVGLCYCYACGKGGDIFKLAATVEGLSSKQDFAAVVESIAAAVDMTLRREEPQKGRPRTLPDKDGNTPARTCLREWRAALDEEPPAMEFLPPDLEAQAWQAVQFAKNNLDGMKVHAHALGLPLAALGVRTDKELAALGLLGLDISGALLYVYTHKEAGGQWRITAVKRRAFPHEVERGFPRFTAWRGSKKQALWGAPQLLEGKPSRVIITEGESDALAVEYSLASLLDYLSHAEPHHYPPLDSCPIVLAKPDASSFRESWAKSLKGLDVILTIDDDDAGRKGAAATAAILKKAGAARVFGWSPKGKAKDPRAAFNPRAPWRLIESIMNDKQAL